MINAGCVQGQGKMQIVGDQFIPCNSNSGSFEPCFLALPKTYSHIFGEHLRALDNAVMKIFLSKMTWKCCSYVSVHDVFVKHLNEEITWKRL